ncbi:cellular retinoic acid-binding protein 2-like protein [Lates japonicus]|uniref:Cellular retinoic acid-binding protein 2-like protein n=1 Tax=Lates japonicus TaxID=270547 RepID=A0AAD3NQA1_LATJO|nr:cellular retinoic acid-binding protein 2-like protein [Lates japonicus]
MERKIPDFAGTWEMKSSENFEELLKALNVNVMLRRIAVAAASKPQVEITQDGETLSIRTSTTVRTTHITFHCGQGVHRVHGRTPLHGIQVFHLGKQDSKISCEQTLQKGEGPKTSWTREITNDGKLDPESMNDANNEQEHFPLFRPFQPLPLSSLHHHFM